MENEGWVGWSPHLLTKKIVVLHKLTSVTCKYWSFDSQKEHWLFKTVLLLTGYWGETLNREHITGGRALQSKGISSMEV